MAAENRRNGDSEDGEPETPTFEGQVIFKGNFESSDDDDK